MRSYEANVLVDAPTQRTGTPHRIEPTPNKVFAAKVIHGSNRKDCQKSCQNDPRCNSVTLNIISGNCVLNYGNVVRKLPLGAHSGISSALKFCSTQGAGKQGTDCVNIMNPNYFIC